MNRKLIVRLGLAIGLLVAGPRVGGQENAPLSKDEAVKQLGKAAGVPITQDGIGKQGGRDIDTKDMSQKDIKKIEKAAGDKGYKVDSRPESTTISGKGKDGTEIKETTIHKKPGIQDKAGSSSLDAQNLVNDPEHFRGRPDPKTGKPKLDPKTGLVEPTVADIVSKTSTLNGEPLPGEHPLTKEPGKMTPDDIVNAAKMTDKAMKAGKIQNPELQKKIEAIRGGKTPAEAGINDLAEFQQQCNDEVIKAVQNENKQIQNERTELDGEFKQAEKDLKNAKAGGDPKEIETARKKFQDIKERAIQYDSHVNGTQQKAINNGADDLYAKANGYEKTTTPEGQTKYIDPETGEAVSKNKMVETVTKGKNVKLQTTPTEAMTPGVGETPPAAPEGTKPKGAGEAPDGKAPTSEGPDVKAKGPVADGPEVKSKGPVPDGPQGAAGTKPGKLGKALETGGKAMMAVDILATADAGKKAILNGEMNKLREVALTGADAVAGGPVATVKMFVERTDENANSALDALQMARDNWAKADEQQLRVDLHKFFKDEEDRIMSERAKGNNAPLEAAYAKMKKEIPKPTNADPSTGKVIVTLGEEQLDNLKEVAVGMADKTVIAAKFVKATADDLEEIGEGMQDIGVVQEVVIEQSKNLAPENMKDVAEHLAEKTQEFLGVNQTTEEKNAETAKKVADKFESKGMSHDKAQKTAIELMDSDKDKQKELKAALDAMPEPTTEEKNAATAKKLAAKLESKGVDPKTALKVASDLLDHSNNETKKAVKDALAQAEAAKVKAGAANASSLKTAVPSEHPDASFLSGADKPGVAPPPPVAVAFKPGVPDPSGKQPDKDPRPDLSNTATSSVVAGASILSGTDKTPAPATTPAGGTKEEKSIIGSILDIFSTSKSDKASETTTAKLPAQTDKPATVPTPPAAKADKKPAQVTVAIPKPSGKPSVKNSQPDLPGAATASVAAGAAYTPPPGGDVFYGSTLAIAFGAPDGYICPGCGKASPKNSWHESREVTYSDYKVDISEVFIYCPKCNYRWALDRARQVTNKTEPPPTNPDSEVGNTIALDHPDASFLGGDGKTPAPVAAPGKPATGKRFVFQSSPTVTFDPLESTDGRTTVTFDRLGPVKIWAAVYSSDSAQLAETPQATYVVGKPTFAIACSPMGAKIGQEVRAQVTAAPQIPETLVSYIWTAPPQSVLIECSADKIAFLPKDSRPITLFVEARTPYGEMIGSASFSYEPALYTVTAVILGRSGPKPLIWDKVRMCFVPVPDGTYIVDEAVGLRATLAGDPKPDPVRWDWQVNEGTTLQGSGLGEAISVTRSEPGTATATVTVKDKDGLELCFATASCVFSLLEKEPLSIVVTAVTATLKSGVQTTVSAASKGGKPPYTVTWTGAQGQNETAVFAAERAGKQKVTATVTDAAGATATGTVELTVEAVTLEVVIRAENRPLLPGETLPLGAGARGGKPPYRFSWTGTENTEGERATFHAVREGIATVGLHATDTWDNTGEASIALTVKALTLRAEIVGVTGEPVLLWDEISHTLKPVAGQYAAGQGVRVRATVDGATLPVGAEFTWSAGINCRLAGAARGAESEVTLEAKGTAAAAVTLSSPGAGVLAQTTVKIPVAISREDIESSKKKDADWKKLQALIAEGAALEKDEKFEEAIEKYRAALALKDDSLIRQRIVALEKKIADRKKALELIGFGEAMERSGNLGAAVKAYEEALGLIPNNDLKQRVAELKIRIAKVQELVNLGYAQEQAGNLAGAVALYQEALAINPDQTLQKRADELTAQIENNARAQELVNRGYAEEQEGKLAEAIATYQEALAIKPDQTLQQRIDQLTAQIEREARAVELVNLGFTQEQAGKLAEAVATYQKALAVKSYPELQQRIDQLTARIEREARAQQFVQRGYALEQAQNLRGAIEQYKAANQLSPNTKMAQHIANLQAKLAAQIAAQATPPPSVQKPAQTVQKASKTVAVTTPQVKTVPPPAKQPSVTPKQAVATAPRYDLRGTYKGRVAVMQMDNGNKIYADVSMTIQQTGDNVTLHIFSRVAEDDEGGVDVITGRIVGDRIEANGQTLSITDGGRTLVDTAGGRFSR